MPTSSIATTSSATSSSSLSLPHHHTVTELITFFSCEDEPIPSSSSSYCTTFVRSQNDKSGIRTSKVITKTITISAESKLKMELIEAERRERRIQMELEKAKTREQNIQKQAMKNEIVMKGSKRSLMRRAAKRTKNKISSILIRDSSRDDTINRSGKKRGNSLENSIGSSSRFTESFSDSRLLEMFQHPSGMPIEPDVMMEGYLYKRSSNAFKTWNRRWFQIKDKQLLYSHRSNELEPATVMEENLRICLVRPAPSNIDRVGCFELVTPTRIHLLQADSESLCQDWMRALQRTILALHEGDSSDQDATSPRNKTVSSSSAGGVSTVNAISPSSNQLDITKRRSVSDPASTSGNTSLNVSSIASSNAPPSTTAFEQIRRVPGNEVCADCGSPAPKWVSINLGVVLCIECSGAHRSLGVQTSKVRSLCMDSIDNELRDVLLALGNRQVNAIFLAHFPSADSIVPPPINEKSARPAREAWIKAKYVERRFAVSEDTRARSSATNRQEHLKHKTSISIGGNSNGVNRSSSYADVQEAEQHSGLLEADPWSSDLSIPVSPASKRLSACGSDTDLDVIGNSIDTGSVNWESVKEACESGDLLALLKAHAQGFDLNSLHNGTSALNIATKSGQTAAVEFLLLNGAKINMLDEKLNTPLHLAAKEGHTLQVCQLLKRGADNNLANVDSKTPLDIAMECTHADIVTLFRVTIMRNEFNADFNNPMDETVEVVISDIARRAATEKEQKKTASLKETSETSEI
uniref:Arf-GAP with coiled-coil, ANK repeat and PH domain-containing protein 2 n=1 Tax=Caenorhabditis tropicalis TaxID=1561998 RepID=A0A1I7UUN2_9PELO